MSKTKHEIFTQYEALRKTFDYLINKKGKIRNFLDNTEFKSITFIGCGSSYSLCKSAAISSKIRIEKPIHTFAAGDLMINFSSYKDILKDTLLISPTRSGSTSEVINAIKLAKENLKVSCISVSTCVNSPVSQFADLSLEMPWAFDESVCQTRTVTNLYMADLMLIAMISDDNALIKEIESAISYGEAYIKKYSSVLEQVANKNSWNKVVVLADSELEGIAEEGALAFSEICQLHSNYYHILDLRHGPMVLIDNKTLVIVALSPSEVSYQLDLINDVKQKGAVVIAVSGRPDNIWEADIDIVAEKYKNYGVMGIPFIFVPQALSYYKAIAAGINPDEPQGLYPWIKL